MKDNEIIKLLECCSGKCEEDCQKNCPIEGVRERLRDIFKDSLDLINRQKAEIERLQDIIISNDEERLSSSAIMMKKEQELMHAERISGLEAEIERMTAEANRYKRYYFNHEYDQLKFEAYKEFAERLKENTYFLKDDDGFDCAVVFVSDIDNLLEEMESERE